MVFFSCKKKTIREKIIEASKDLFETMGICNVSVDRICSKIKISKKTFYNYFDNKDRLILVYVVNHVNNISKNDFVENPKRGNEIERLVLTFLNVYKKKLDIEFQNYICIEEKYPNVENFSSNLLYKLGYNFLSRNVENGIKNGLYRKNINVDLVTKIHIISYYKRPKNYIKTGIDFADISLRNQLIKLFLYSIVSIEGIKIFEKIIDKYNL